MADQTQATGDGARSKEEARQEARAMLERFGHEAEELSRHAGAMMKRPAVGAAVAGAAVLAAGAIWGATEAALAVVATYVVFRMLTKRRGQEPERRAAESSAGHRESTA